LVFQFIWFLNQKSNKQEVDSIFLLLLTWISIPVGSILLYLHVSSQTDQEVSDLTTNMLLEREKILPKPC
jgi:hypothetical protein